MASALFSKVTPRSRSATAALSHTRVRGAARAMPSKARCVKVQAGPVVYGHPGTRSPLVDWYLHEVGCEFEARMPNHPDNPHPFGQVPALQDDDGVEVWESGAILLYLADRYGGLDTPAARAKVGKWVVWANATLDPILFKENDNGKVIGTGAGGNPKGLVRLESFLEKQQWLAGADFSVADVAVGAYLLYVPQFFPNVDMGKWPNISQYMLRCSQRPAFARAFGDNTAQYCQSAVQQYLATPQKSGGLGGLFGKKG